MKILDAAKSNVDILQVELDPIDPDFTPYQQAVLSFLRQIEINTRPKV